MEGSSNSLFQESPGSRNYNSTCTGMTSVTVNWRPSYFTVMTFSTILTLNNLLHINIIGTLSHKEYLFMANLTLKSDTMEPVREYYRRHACLLCVSVQREVGIFSLCRRKLNEAKNSNNKG